MISQKCPKCRSLRIRRGYRSTPLWSKILCRYHLLCDSCNLEFKGFAVPGTVTSRPNRRARKHTEKETNVSAVTTEPISSPDKIDLEPIAIATKPKSKKKRSPKIKTETAE